MKSSRKKIPVTFYLFPEQKAGIEALSTKRRTPMAELYRDAVAEMLADRGTGSDVHDVDSLVNDIFDRQHQVHPDLFTLAKMTKQIIRKLVLVTKERDKAEAEAHFARARLAEIKQIIER